MTKIRLDALLVEKGLFDSREKARRAVLAGQVRIDERIADKPGVLTDTRASVLVRQGPGYVSRGADKLIRALDTFKLDIAGKAALDVGASTGGFTEVLLTKGARRVMAVDVGYGQLAWKIRQDQRVDVFERTNIRYLKFSDLPEPADVVTADLSFISLVTVADSLLDLSSAAADFIFLIKPQFEAGKGRVGKGGIIRGATQHQEILANVLSRLEDRGFIVEGLTYSPIAGADGNIEFLAHLRRQEFETKNNKSKTVNLTREDKSQDLSELIEKVVSEAHSALPKKREEE